MKKMFALLLAASMLGGAALAETTVDATTGASQVTTPDTQLPQEEIKALALEYLRGFPLTKNEDGTTKEWAYREMYQIATVHDNMPGLSSVEFVIDPETMRLYASSEKGTEKVVDISKNENVVMYWYKQIPEDEYVPQVNDYFNSYGVQNKGTARLMTARRTASSAARACICAPCMARKDGMRWTRRPSARPSAASRRSTSGLKSSRPNIT